MQQFFPTETPNLVDLSQGLWSVEPRFATSAAPVLGPEQKKKAMTPYSTVPGQYDTKYVSYRMRPSWRTKIVVISLNQLVKTGTTKLQQSQEL